ANRLSHLLRHQPAEVLGVLAQGLGRLAHQPSTLIEADAPPGEGGIMDLADDVLDLTGLPFLVVRERLAIGRVDRMERHGSTPDNCFLPLRRAGGRAVRYNPEHFSSEVESDLSQDNALVPFPNHADLRAGAAAPASLMLA